MTSKKPEDGPEAQVVPSLEDGEFFGEATPGQTVVPSSPVAPEPEEDDSGLGEILNLPAEPSAYQQVAARVLDPGNQVTPAERQEARSLTSASDGSIKKSLVSLIAGNFNKIKTYDDATQQAIDIALQRLGGMEPMELVGFIQALSKVSASESKNLLELFKKNDGEVKKIILEVQGPASSEAVPGAPGQSVESPAGKPLLRPEIADGLLRMVANLQKRKADRKAEKKANEMEEEVDD